MIKTLSSLWANLRPQAAALTDAARLDMPIELHVAFLANVTRDDAEAYVIGYIRSRTVSERVYYGLFPFRNGFIYEIHEGGSGHAYVPTLLERIAAFDGREFKGILISSRKKIQISHTERDFSTMAIPQDRDVRAAILIEPAYSRLKAIQFNHGFQMLLMTSALCLVAIGVLLAAGASRPQASEIYLEQVETTQLPLYRLRTDELASVNERKVAIRFEDGQWSIEKKQVEEAVMFESAPLETEELTHE